MKRKIETLFAQWKSTPNHKPLIVKGCRQCGKTYSVLEFAKTHYKNVVYIDFHRYETYRTLFSGSLEPDDILMKISSAFPNVSLIPKDTCIILDEIQECPRARAALKFLHLDGRFDYICTGSLLGVNGYQSPDKEAAFASIPVGYETIIDMYPMDFEEFLWANGIKENIIEHLYNAFHNETPVDEFIHHRMRELLLQYVVVGGMPAVVSDFVQERNLANVLMLQRSIIDEYRGDMVKYASNADKPRIRKCFDSIPAQLSRENKKFTYATIEKGARAKDYWSCLQWIEDAGIIRRCRNLSITELPLDGNAENDTFKIYMADTGLFISMLEDGTQSDIINGNLGGYKGAVFENVVADMLGKMGRKLYYYHKDSGLELDFVLRYRGECVPLECKAVSGRAKSLRTVLGHPEKYHITHAIKLGDYNVGRTNALLTLPMYMGFLLRDM